MEHAQRERRDIRMLRMGKRPLGLLRMGRSAPLSPDYFTDADFDERQLVQVPRVGKDIDIYPHRGSRSPPFPRVGDERLRRYLDEYRRLVNANDYDQVLTTPRVGRRVRSTDSIPIHLVELHQRAAPLPRLGLRELLDHLSESAAPLPRLGLRVEDEEERAAPFPRLGLRQNEYDEENENEIENERAVPLPRLGDRDADRAAPFPRFGERELDEKAMMRAGRSGNSDPAMEKRPMSMLRMGKRAMSMLRMGKRDLEEGTAAAEDKRGMSMLRMGKKSMGMLRMGRSEYSNPEEEKRAMGMLRMGRSEYSNPEEEKRAMGMLRMGRALDTPEEEAAESGPEKRTMGMLRMGRSMGMLRMGRSMEPEEEKRTMGMLRMGKRPATSKRLVSMLRMGKRAMGMLRMGKRGLDDDDVHHNDGETIEKRSVQTDLSHVDSDSHQNDIATE